MRGAVAAGFECRDGRGRSGTVGDGRIQSEPAGGDRRVVSGCGKGWSVPRAAGGLIAWNGQWPWEGAISDSPLPPARFPTEGRIAPLAL